VNEETVHAVGRKVILVFCSGIDEKDRILGEAERASSNETREERGGSGSESHEVGPSGQIVLTSAYWNMSFLRVDANIYPEDDEIDLAKR
jgi:hypothetical protein